jgi:hypothetical protein
MMEKLLCGVESRLRSKEETGGRDQPAETARFDPRNLNLSPSPGSIKE